MIQSKLIMLNKILLSLKHRGLSHTLSSVRQYFHPRSANCFSICEKLLVNKVGLEIGGLSSIFQDKGIFPIYSIVHQLDNCNFSASTTWEGQIAEGQNFNFNQEKSFGFQYISEATDLYKIDSTKYDFLLSSHMLEHTANPLKALNEWTRVLKDDGILVLILPHKDGTFDNQRPVTSLEHILEDFDSGTKEDDLTHLPEILELHNLNRDPEAGDLESFKERSKSNFDNRCLHHHVFDTNLVAQILDHQLLMIHAIEPVMPCHIIAIAQKQPLGSNTNNQNFLNDAATYRHSSPFLSDKLANTVKP
jgi:SAM-dependent methyltransferase